MPLRRASLLAALAVPLALACVPRTPATTAAPPTDLALSPTAPPPLAADAKFPRCNGEPVPAIDGLIDDLEDENSQVALVGDRDGYWWIAKDDLGTTVTDPPDSFKPSEGGFGGSALSAHMAGHTVEQGYEAWGVELGANFLSTQGGVYDASKYAGITFKAKVGQNSINYVRVNVTDVNTHKDAGVCRECWNHFRKDFALTTEWKEYRLLFSELRQREGWGNPRPERVTPTQVISVTFALGGMEGDFDLWVDDVEFLECKK